MLGGPWRRRTATNSRRIVRFGAGVCGGTAKPGRLDRLSSRFEAAAQAQGTDRSPLQKRSPSSCSLPAYAFWSGSEPVDPRGRPIPPRAKPSVRSTWRLGSSSLVEQYPQLFRLQQKGPTSTLLPGLPDVDLAHAIIRDPAARKCRHLKSSALLQGRCACLTDATRRSDHAMNFGSIFVESLLPSSNVLPTLPSCSKPKR